MKYMLLMSYAGGAGCDVPMTEWPPEDIAAHMEFQQALGKELTDSGELVGAEGLAAPELAQIVTSDGTTPVVTDGPFPESKEFLAGYWMIDVATPERAIEIAARASAAPAVGGLPIQTPIEVRQLMSVPASDV